MLKRVFLLTLCLVLIGGGALWFVANSPEAPALSFAKVPQKDELSSTFTAVTHDVDGQVAALIRQAAAGDLSVPNINPQQFFDQKSISQASLSATVSTTPQELWDTLRKEGAQAALGSVASQAQVSVNGVSGNVVNEARYQYCKGVVDQYEQAPVKSE